MNEQRHASTHEPAPSGLPAVLIGSRGRETGKGIFPEIPATSPSAPRFEPFELSRVATLYSYTVIHPNPKSGLSPFALVYADFPEGVRVFGRLVLAEGRTPQIGMSLTTEFSTDTPYIFVETKGKNQ